MQYLSEKSYLAIKPETTAGTAVAPTIVVPLISENMKTVVNHVADRRMQGVDWKAADMLRGNRSHEGEVVVYGDPDTLAHFVNMVLEKGVTTGDADGYVHPFEVGDPKTYTIEIGKGAYAQRYIGAKIDEMKLDFEDGKLRITAKIMAMGQVSVASVGVALTGAGMTSLTLGDEYDIEPNRGLVVGDKLNINGTQVTLTSVDTGGLNVGFASTAITASIGAPVYLVPQTITLPDVQEPFYFGNLLVGVGVDSTESASNAADRATATKVYDLSIILKNNLFAQNGTNRIDPVQILTRTKEGQVELSRLLEDTSQRLAWQGRSKQAITIAALGRFIATDFSTQEALVITFNRVKLLENENPVQVGEYIVDKQKFEVLYDADDGQALDLAITNRTAGTVYGDSES